MGQISAGRSRVLIKLSMAVSCCGANGNFLVEHTVMTLRVHALINMLATDVCDSPFVTVNQQSREVVCVVTRSLSFVS